MKKQKFILLACCCLIWNAFFSQTNLVPNFSFEQRDTCPTVGDQIQYCTGWFKSSGNSSTFLTNTTPDYYNACSPDTLMGVPRSSTGFQYAHRNCNAYVGLVSYEIPGYPNYREHVGIQLSSPLVIGQKYFLSFYTVMGGDLLEGGYYYTMPSNKIGMKLSTIPFTENNPAPINNFAHLYLQSVLNDTLNWTLVSGSIIADSSYKYLALGNFFDDANTDTVHWNCSQCQNIFGYFLLDDICISTDSLLCNGGINSMTCTTSINEINSDFELKLFPNPVSDFLTISIRGNMEAEVLIYDIYGAVAFATVIKGRSILVNLSTLPSGTYALKIVNKTKNNYTTKKIIKL